MQGSKSKAGAIKCWKENKITAPPNAWHNIPLLTLSFLLSFTYACSSYFICWQNEWPKMLGNTPQMVNWHFLRTTKIIKLRMGSIYVTDSVLSWAGPLACLSLPSVISWIRSDTPIWKLALSQSCSSRIKDGRKRVECLRSLLKNEIDVQYSSG